MVFPTFTPVNAETFNIWKKEFDSL